MNILKKLYNKLKPKSVQWKRVQPWFEINGDKTLRIDYDLKKTDYVFDLGGYEGEWSNDIFNKYEPNIYIFEPLKSFYDMIEIRFENNQRVKCFNFGLGKENKSIDLVVSDNSTSSFINKKNAKIEKGKIVPFSEFINKHQIDFIHLMKINIEGGEYELLENIIENGFQNKIGNLQIQFHDFVPNATDLMKKIQGELSKTHELTYQYEFVWENWKIKHNG